MSFSRSGLIVLAAIAVLAPAPAIHGQTRATTKTPVVSAGNGTLYVGSYKGVIFEIDEATEKIKREIPVSVGIPIGLTLSDDMSRIYVRDAGYEKVEIIDRVKGTSLGSFTLTEGKSKTRIWAMRPDPQHKTLILTIKKYTLESDKWVIGPPTLVQYDVAARKIVRTIPWPKGEEREGVNVMFSPDGKLLYMFSEDILIYETTNFTEVDRWDVTRPIEPCAGSSSRRRRSISIPSGPRAGSGSLSRPIASAATGCSRRSTSGSSGRSISRTIA
jgi:DNA-binding beta-propeller fold protein YncE